MKELLDNPSRYQKALSCNIAGWTEEQYYQQDEEFVQDMITMYIQLNKSS